MPCLVISYPADPQYFNTHAVQLFGRIREEFQSPTIYPEDSLAILGPFTYETRNHTDVFIAHTEAHALWLMINAPEGYTILEA